MLAMKRGSWSEIRAGGMGPFVWHYGVVYFGATFFVVNTVVRWLSNNPDQRYDPAIVLSLVIVSFVYALMAGAAFGIVAWLLLGLILRKSVPRSP